MACPPHAGELLLQATCTVQALLLPIGLHAQEMDRIGTAEHGALLTVLH